MNHNYTLKIVADKVANHLDIDIRDKSRKRECVYARVIYYKLCREYTHHTLERIGKEVYRDHASVYVGLKQFESMAFYKDNYWKAYLEIKQEFDKDAVDFKYSDKPYLYWRKKYFTLKRKLINILDEKEVTATN